MTYEMSSRGGISFNERGETSLPGLYAGGDEYLRSSASRRFGWIAGENAAAYAAEAERPWTLPGERIRSSGQGLLRIHPEPGQTGAGWQEVNIAVNQVMSDYAGTPRSETLLTAGLSHL